MIRTLTNISNADVILNDFNGLTIQAGETVDGLMFGDTVLRNSVDVLDALLDNQLQISDGSLVYAGAQAVDLLKGITEQLTRDGKRIITSSDRPKDHYRHFTSAGDDVQNKIRGAGTQLIFQVQPGDTQVIDTAFIDDLYLKDGMILYQNAEIGSWISVDIIAPAGTPYPAIFGDGNTDLVNGHLVPNTDGTGDYFVHNTDEVYLKFVNKMLLLGTCRETTSAPEPSFLPKTVFQRFTMHNASTDNVLNAVVTMGLYRERTV
jgi:hypothetical protein